MAIPYEVNIRGNAGSYIWYRLGIGLSRGEIVERIFETKELDLRRDFPLISGFAAARASAPSRIRAGLNEIISSLRHENIIEDSSLGLRKTSEALFIQAFGEKVFRKHEIVKAAAETVQVGQRMTAPLGAVLADELMRAGVEVDDPIALRELQRRAAGRNPRNRNLRKSTRKTTPKRNSATASRRIIDEEDPDYHLRNIWLDRRLYHRLAPWAGEEEPALDSLYKHAAANLVSQSMLDDAYYALENLSPGWFSPSPEEEAGLPILVRDLKSYIPKPRPDNHRWATWIMERDLLWRNPVSAIQAAFGTPGLDRLADDPKLRKALGRDDTMQTLAVVSDQFMHEGMKVRSPEAMRRIVELATAKNPSRGGEPLIAQCQKLWEHYCARPGKKRLKEVLSHLETMKSSKSAKVKLERRRCLRAANREAKELGI